MDKLSVKTTVRVEIMFAIIFTVSLISVVNCNSDNTTANSTKHSTEAVTHSTATSPTVTALPSTTTTHATNSSGPWVVYYDEVHKSSYCLIMSAVIDIKLEVESKPPVTHWFEIGPDTHVTISGACGNSTNRISIKQKSLSVSLTFSKNKDNTYNMSHIAFTYNETVELNTTEVQSWLNNLDYTKCYTCNKNQTVFSAVNETVQITVKELRLEVFQNITNSKPEFTLSAQSCETTDSLIPIIVGAALGGLIIIVLVAYLIGRHRSRRGYESV